MRKISKGCNYVSRVFVWSQYIIIWTQKLTNNTLLNNMYKYDTYTAYFYFVLFDGTWLYSQVERITIAYNLYLQVCIAL